MFKVDFPVKFPIFHCGSSTSSPFNLQDLIVDSPFKVLREFDFRSGKQPLPDKFGYSHYLDNEWILLGEVTG